MEVHQHAHSGQKKWTHYIWDFLMLFLAVFCGFLAENKREHLVEDKRAKVYAKNFLNDLNEDTIEIQTAIRSELFRQAAMDSLVSISASFHENSMVPATFYYYSRFMSNLYTVDWNSSTINQLVQSGNLRLFKNLELIRKIDAYYAQQNIINRATQISHERRMKALDLRGKILQSRYYALFGRYNFMTEQKKDNRLTIDSLNRITLPLTPDANKYMDEYINALIDWSSSLQSILKSSLPKMVIAAKEIMVLLKEEYHLK